MASPFTFGAQAQPTSTTQTATSQFSFGAPKTTAPILSLTNPGATTAAGAAGGFNFGLNKTTAATNLFGTPAATTAATGFGLGGGLNPTTSTATSASTGFGFNAAASTAGSTGFGFNLAKPSTTSTTSGFGLGLGAAAATTTSSFSLGGGGLFASSSTAGASTAAPSIFSSVPSTSTTAGLGGLDPNTALKQGSGDAGGSSSDGKTVKETILLEPLAATVDSLQKFVKEEKTVREDIARISSKPMMKVQEDVTALKQLLSVVANGLQRNACAVDKLKQEMTQKLKNAEMAQRTKDIPAGLQYENTAPTEFFQRLVEEFEDRMMMYRQQIETLDRHLAAMHQPNPHTPESILTLLKKLHETFISLTAQLQVVHEAMRAQKDHFLTYRRVFHGDSKNIFHKANPAPKPVVGKQLSDLAGPTPFHGTSNIAAHAMAMVHTRAQQPQGPPVTGLGMGTNTGFGTSSFGNTGIFGAPKPVPGLGSAPSSIGGVGSLFSSTSTGLTGDFGSPASASTTAALNLAGTNLNMSANTKQPFQLQKPPLGAKRGKR